MRTGKVFSITALSFAALMFTPQMASAERVCRTVCNDNGFCRERCVNREPSVEIRTEGRGHRQEGWREERRERPGVELRVPGIGVEIGR